MTRIASISTKFENHVGFSNGWAELTLKKPAAVGAEQLDRLLRRHRSEGERLDHALGREHERDHDRGRQQDVDDRPGEVDVEDADLLAGARRQAADERNQDGDPDARREEVLDGQAGHLGEVREGRLAGVELPVRVGHERRRGVERQVIRRALQAHDHVQRERAGDAEHEDRAGVALPVLAGQPVESQRPLDAPDGAREDPRQVAADERRQRCQQPDVDGDLEHQNRSGRSSAASR
jgi:hypothetical protein